MIALGIDPGTLRLGWGVVSRAGNRLTYLAHGVIKLDSRLALAERLCRIEVGLDEVIKNHSPDMSSVETLFFHKDAQAAAKLGHARGVVLLTLARAGVPIGEYAPAKVKRTIAGGGQADKRQVALMVRALLGLSELPPADAADALALAITHLRLGPVAERLGQRSLPPALAAALAGRSRGRKRRRGAGNGI